MEQSAVTGRLEPMELPAWKRRAFRYLVSFPIIGLCLLAVFFVMFLMLRLQVIKPHLKVIKATSLPLKLFDAIKNYHL